MKKIASPQSGGSQRAGCVCSDGQAKTRGLFDPIWSCKCQCAGGTANNNANHYKADRA
ncbi:MAG: hypothetical protein R3Y24_13460 [Eubacteriales bacterium]